MAYSLRSAIVHAIGSLLHKAFDRSADWQGEADCGQLCNWTRLGSITWLHCHAGAYPRCALPGLCKHETYSLPGSRACSSAVADAADAQGAQARLRSKQHLLDLLSERIRQACAWPLLWRRWHMGGRKLLRACLPALMADPASVAGS